MAHERRCRTTSLINNEVTATRWSLFHPTKIEQLKWFIRRLTRFPWCQPLGDTWATFNRWTLLPAPVLLVAVYLIAHFVNHFCRPSDARLAQRLGFVYSLHYLGSNKHWPKTIVDHKMHNIPTEPQTENGSRLIKRNKSAVAAAAVAIRYDWQMVCWSQESLVTLLIRFKPSWWSIERIDRDDWIELYGWKLDGL